MRFTLADELQRILLRTNFPISEEELARLINLYADNLEQHYYENGFPRRPLISRAEQLNKIKPLAEVLKTALRRMLADETQYVYHDFKVDNQKIQLLLNAGTDIQIDPHDDWGKEVIGWLKDVPNEEKQQWIKLMEHCLAGGSKSTPSDKWMKETEKLLSGINKEFFMQKMQEWLSFNVALLKQAHKDTGWGKGYLRDANMNLLKGLIWCCGFPGELY